jgi:hypothetical protein
MNAVVVRRNVIQYRGQAFQYDSDDVAIEASSQPTAAKRSKRPFRSSRRRTKGAGNHPGYGMAGRRNHRWAW